MSLTFVSLNPNDNDGAPVYRRVSNRFGAEGNPDVVGQRESRNFRLPPQRRWSGVQ